MLLKWNMCFIKKKKRTVYTAMKAGDNLVTFYHGLYFKGQWIKAEHANLKENICVLLAQLSYYVKERYKTLHFEIFLWNI